MKFLAEKDGFQMNDLMCIPINDHSHVNPCRFVTSRNNSNVVEDISIQILFIPLWSLYNLACQCLHTIPIAKITLLAFWVFHTPDYAGLIESRFTCFYCSCLRN